MFLENSVSKMVRLGRNAALHAVVLAGAFSSAAFAQDSSSCGSLQNGYGPVDYRTAPKASIEIVTNYHFTPQVEALIKGSAGYLGGDLDYTLRAIPNHPRALMSAMRYSEKTKLPQPPNMNYTVECYFMRALRFKPDDTVVRLLYATFLQKNGREADAVRQVDLTQTYASDNPFTHYNMGLVYFDLKQYDKSLAQAHIAEGLGFPQTGLREQLQAAGKWKDAPLPALESPASAAAPTDGASAPAAAQPQ